MTPQGTPMANLLLAVAQKCGVEQDRFGVSRGGRSRVSSHGKAGRGVFAEIAEAQGNELRTPRVGDHRGCDRGALRSLR